MPLLCRVALLLGCIAWTPAAQCPDDADVDLCDIDESIRGGYGYGYCPDDPEVDLCDDIPGYTPAGLVGLCPDDPDVDLCDESPAGGGGGGGGFPNGCPDDPDVDLCDEPIVVHSVVLTMGLTVPDPQAFVASSAARDATKAGVANAAGVTLDKVSVVLSVAGRRRLDGRRLQESNVNVEATIQADNADAASSLQQTVNAVSTDDMAAALNTALEATGITVQVASLSAAVQAVEVSGGAGLPAVSGDWTWPEGAAWNAQAGSMCDTGMQQSPIDLPVCTNGIEAHVNPIVATWGVASEVVHSRGIKINMPSGGFATTMSNEAYTLLQCELHWGSEHTFNGNQEALSMHCFHSKDQVAAGGRAHGALGIIWEVGAEDPFLDGWIATAPTRGGAAVTDASIDMALALGGLNLAHYWQYNGGFTTPPCSESVIWHVLMGKRTLSQAQLDTIIAKTDVPGGNFRLPQPAHGRVALGCLPFTESWTWPEDDSWNTIQFSVCGTGREQSPIDIRVCDEIVPSTNPIIPNWGTATRLSNSRGLKIIMPEGANAFQTSMRGQMYTMEQCHLHYGSEHYFDGMQELMSMECLHNKDVVTADSPRPKGMLSFIFTEGTEDAFLAQWIAGAPGDGEADVTGATVEMALAVDGMTLSNYWQYEGGLTTPPCSEAVDWHVLMDKRTMSRAQLETIITKTGLPDGNFRRPKPLHARQVLGCLEGQSGDGSELEQDGASRAGWRVALSILVSLSLW